MPCPATLDHSRTDPDAGAATGPEAVLDLVHLSRQSFGDHSLELELLALFDRQAAQFPARLLDARRKGDPRAPLELAHMLKGSARAVGAFAVAGAAQAYEAALQSGDAAAACERLAAEIARVRATLAALA